MSDPKEPHEQILDLYRDLVAASHPTLIGAWPVLSGYNAKIALP